MAHGSDPKEKAARDKGNGGEKRVEGAEKGRDSAKPAEAKGQGELVKPSAATPFGLVRRFIDEMDRLFEDFGMGAMGKARELFGRAGGGAWAPDIDVFERGGKLVVRADLPGLRKEDVKVEIRDQHLVLDGERREEREERREGFHRSEVSYGKFYRSIPLPEGVDPSGAEAKFRDGVLEIELKLPERPEGKGKRIEIR